MDLLVALSLSFLLSGSTTRIENPLWGCKFQRSDERGSADCKYLTAQYELLPKQGEKELRAARLKDFEARYPGAKVNHSTVPLGVERTEVMHVTIGSPPVLSALLLFDIDGLGSAVVTCEDRAPAGIQRCMTVAAEFGWKYALMGRAAKAEARLRNESGSSREQVYREGGVLDVDGDGKPELEVFVDQHGGKVERSFEAGVLSSVSIYSSDGKETLREVFSVRTGRLHQRWTWGPVEELFEEDTDHDGVIDLRRRDIFDWSAPAAKRRRTIQERLRSTADRGQEWEVTIDRFDSGVEF